jgi:hypothetical protein
MSIDTSTFHANKGQPVVAQKPSLLLIPEGGTICSRSAEEGNVLDTEVPVEILSLLSNQRSDLFSKIRQKGNRKLAESQDVTMKRLEQFGRLVQTAMRETQQDIIALVSAHKAPRYAIAAALALSQDDVLSQKTGRNRSLILACCSQAIGEDTNVPLQTVEDAVGLSADTNMRGRGGVLYGDTLHSLTGLETDKSETPVFRERVSKIARKHDNGQWMFTSKLDSQDFAGQGGQFALMPGVRTMVISDDPKQQDQNPQLADIKGRGREKNLTGIVLKTKTHRNPLEVIDPKTLEELGDNGIPILIVGQCSALVNGQAENMVTNTSILNENTRLLDGDGMYSGQAKVVLAEALAASELLGNISEAEKMEFIQERLNSYAFIDRTKAF